MTEQEAKYAIFSGIETNETVNMGENPYFEVFVCAEKALDKQIEKQVKNIGVIGQLYFGRCPNCNKYISDNKNRKSGYCANCGQKIDWRKE